MSTKAALLLFAAFVFSQAGCTRHEVQIAPVEVKPIHITIDVNVKVDRALDNFFGDLDEAEGQMSEGSSGKP